MLSPSNIICLMFYGTETLPCKICYVVHIIRNFVFHERIKNTEKKMLFY